MTYVEMILDNIKYVSSFMTIGSDIKVIIILLQHKFERLKYWELLMGGFVKYTIEVGADSVRFIPNFIKIVSGVRNL